MYTLYTCILFSCSGYGVCVSSDTDLGPSEEGSAGVAGGGPVVLAQLGGLEVAHAALGHHPLLPSPLQPPRTTLLSCSQCVAVLLCCCVTSDTAVHISCCGRAAAWCLAAGRTSLGWTLINGERGAAHLSRGRDHITYTSTRR